jgi:hypothetical protein
LTVLAVKLALVPVLIAAISLAGARLGPRVAGALTGLPVVAGPIALFLALEQGPAFAAHAAVATLAGEGSLAVFCLLYAWTCLGAPWWASVVVGWAGFAAATLLFGRLAPPLVTAAAVALLAPAVILALSPRPRASHALRAVPPGELALRMAAGAALVVALTALAAALGPRLSGLLTVFPVAVSVLAVFSHRAHGGPFAVQLLRGLATGLYSLTAFFATLALTLERLGVAGAFALATVATVATQLVVLQAVRRA